MIDYVELKRHIDLIIGLYRKYNISIKPGQGLADILLEAENIVNGIRIPEDEEKVRMAVKGFHYTWALAETLETCINAGWDVSNHLKQITTGTADYGEPASGSETRKIFYKDFECELFIGSALIKKGLKPYLLDDPDDPKGEIRLGDVIVEVKHPNSTGQVKKLIKKFNKQMRENKCYGVFVIGVEDMFSMGDVYRFDDSAQFDSWALSKGREIERFGRDSIIPLAKHLQQIIGLVQTSTKVYDIASATDFRRLGNSVLLKRNGIPSKVQVDAEAIVRAFNPNHHVFQF